MHCCFGLTFRNIKALALIEAQGSETPCKSLRAFFNFNNNMKQVNLFGQEFAPNQDEKKYSSKIEAPIYEPKNKQPHLLELVNKEKTHRLMKEIEQSNLGIDEKMFLMDAARRHNVFNYEKIADYYAHSNPEMQNLMERSGLVIIDFQKAIQLGYVKLCDEIKTQYLTEYGE